MYRLYWDTGAASLAPRAALEEIGAPYELQRVELARGEQHSPEYLVLNPQGVVPTLVFGDTVMTESHAILLYLADTHPEAALAPPPGDPARPAFLSWLFWLTNTLQVSFLQFRYAHTLVDGEAAQAALATHAEARMTALFSRVNDALASHHGPYLLGERFSAADISLAMITRWSRWAATPGFSFQNVRRHVDSVATRPAYRRTLEQEGIEALA